MLNLKMELDVDDWGRTVKTHRGSRYIWNPGLHRTEDKAVQLITGEAEQFHLKVCQHIQVPVVQPRTRCSDGR